MEQLGSIKSINEQKLDYASSTSVSDTGEAPFKGIDAEVANFFAGETAKAIVIDEATNRRLRMMIHKRVLVVMVVTYFAQTLDKGTVAFASIMGIQADTGLVGQQYAWLTTCVYIAILCWEYPANRMLQRFPIGKLLAFHIFGWGAVLACTAACHNFAGLVAVRSLLGLFESICQPAFVLLSTIWYKREEQTLIIGAFWSMNGLQQCVGGLIGYGISHISTTVLKTWQILFTMLGCITVLWSVFVLWWLPDSPMRARCWSEEDRRLIVERVRANETGVQNKEFKMYQAYEALTDMKVWCIVIISFTNALPTGGLGAFQNIILKAFGFTTLQVYLLAIAQGVVIMSILFSAAWIAKVTNQKLLTAFAYTLPNVVGAIVFLSKIFQFVGYFCGAQKHVPTAVVPTNPHTKVGLLIAFYCSQAWGGVSILNLAVMSGNIAGRTKQVVCTTLCFIAWATGNAIGPQVFQAKDAPRYRSGFAVHLVLFAIQLGTIIFLRVWLMWQNTKKRQAQSTNVAEKNDEHIGHRHAFDDLTDKENPDFRYVY